MVFSVWILLFNNVWENSSILQHLNHVAILYYFAYNLLICILVISVFDQYKLCCYEH